MKVRQLPIDPGPAGWNRLLPNPAPTAALEGRHTADWLIIGAGFAGLSAARRLTQLDPGSRIVVMEAARVGDGPAGRNSGFMVDLPHDLSSDDYGGTLEGDTEQTSDNRRAIEFAARDRGGIRPRPGSVQPSPERSMPRLRSGGMDTISVMPVTWVRWAKRVNCWTPGGCAKSRASDYYRSGLFTPGAAVLQPALYVRGLSEALQSRGVVIHEESPVTELRRSGDWVAESLRGQVTSPNVVLAVNGHLNSFGFHRGRLAHIFTYASMTRALTPDEIKRLGGSPNWGVTPADPLGTSVRRISGTGGDRIVVRNRFTFDPSMEIGRSRLRYAARSHDRSFAARFPMLKGVGMEFRWGGRLCLSLNGVQVIGKLEDGLYSACCQNGLGTAKGTLAGLLVAELACGFQSDALDRAVSAPLPRRLPPMPLARVGAWARIRFFEARAGGEL